MDSWSAAVLEWVNCLDILDAAVNDLKELQDGKFYSKLIKILSKTDCQDDCDDNHLVSRFIEDTYPEFLGRSKGKDENCEEIYVASLLLLHASQEPKLHRPMCIKLSNETQLKIKSFLEKLLQYGSNITKDDVGNAIKETAENLVRTPPVTPKMRPLKDFFNSPVTTVRKNYNRMMDQRTREVRSLKAELETEKFEKADLLEDLEIQREKNSSLQKKLQDKIAEIKKLREESVGLQTPQSSKKKKEVKTPKHRVSPKVQAMTDEIALLKSEIGNLEEEKQSLMRKLASAERHCVTFKDRSEMNERNLETLLIQVDLKDREIEDLKSHNEELRAHIEEKRRQTIAEQSFEMEMAMSTSVNSLDASEVLSSVIEIQLQEAKEESLGLKSQLEELNNRLRAAQDKNQDLQNINEALQAEVGVLQATKQQLCEARRELGEYIKTSNTLEQEKLCFQAESKKFEALFLSKEKSLEQSEQQIESLKIRLHDLEIQLTTTRDLLSKEGARVRDLETVVSQKVEILKSEGLRYLALDEQHIMLKREMLGLVEETNDLKNLVSVKEDLLKQAQEQREALQLDLHNLKEELKTLQDLLNVERSGVKSLESMMSQMKLEHEKSLEAQVSRYRDLEEKYVNLEAERVSLLREMEDLNSKIVSSEKLLKQSSQKNDDLASNLQDVSDKLQTAQHALGEERKRVVDLESIITRVEIDKKEFAESQFSKYQTLEEEYATLDREKLSLVKQIEDLHNSILSKEQMLTQSSKARETLDANLRDLNEKLLAVQDLLREERTKVKDLESTITDIKREKAESFQCQLASYHALEKLHTNLEQEKLDLIKDTENLKNSLLSKEEMIQQSQQHNAQLQCDLCDVKNERKNVQHELNTAIIKVESLESVLAQTRLETDKITQANKDLCIEISLLKSANQELREAKEQMHKQSQELEQEKSRLLKEIEERRRHTLTKEELLIQTQQQNETLQTKLNDLGKEVKSVHNLLDAKNTRVVDLESAITHITQEKQEALQCQLTSYQALEEMHKNVEQEKSELLKDTENLKNVLLSQKGLLQQSQEHNAKLQFDLRAMEDEIKTVQNELNTATTQIKSLEYDLAETKLGTDKIVQTNEDLCAEINLLKSAKQDLCDVKEELYKQSQELEHEKSRLLGEIEELKIYASSKEKLLEQTQQQNDTLQAKLNSLGEDVKSLHNLLDAKSTRIGNLESAVTHITQEKEETLQSQLTSYQTLQVMYKNLEQEKSELLKYTEDLKNVLSSKEELLEQSQECNAKLEFDLCAVKDELNIATTNVKNLESDLAQTKLEYDKIIHTNGNLRAEISLLKSGKQDLYEVKEQLHKQNKDLEQEKSSLLGEIEELKTQAFSNEQLLKQIQQANETLHTKLNDLGEEVKLVQNSLEAKSTRVVDLESAITHITQEKEETLQNQLTSYQALNEMHQNVEKEKSELLKDTENLKNLLSSQERLLQQSQEHNIKLESDLSAMKDEIKTVQNELDTATTKVKSLESDLAETRLETDKIIQTNEDLCAEINLLKSAKQDLYAAKEQLHMQSQELKQEKSRLLGEIEELKTHALSKEELLKQTQQQNDTLQSKLNNLSEEVKSVENLLSTESSRVKDLESIISETESEKKESLIIIQQLKSENDEHKNLIQSCSSILTQLVKHSSQLTGDETTSIGDLTILDLSKQLKTLINSLEVIHSTKDSKVKNFETSVSTLNLTVSKLTSDLIHFEEMKKKDDQLISEYLKEITDLRLTSKEKENLLKDVDELQEQLSNERSKINSLNEEKKVMGANLIDVKRSLIALKNDKLILIKNVENQNEDLLTKMASISDIIVKMQSQVHLDNETILHLRKEKTLLASKYEEEKKVTTDLEAKCSLLENDNKNQTKEKKELKDKLNAIRVRNAKLEKTLDELRKENKKLEIEKPSGDEQLKVEELTTSISNLHLQIQQLEADKIKLSKRPTEQDFDSRLKEIHIEYDQKLENLKQKMKLAYNEQIEKVNRDQDRLMQDKLNAQRLKMEEQCRKHAEEITRYKEHVTKLSSDYWDVGEKLLVEKQQKEQLVQQLQDLRKQLQFKRAAVTNNSMSQPASTNRSKTSSLDRREFVATTREEVCASRTVGTIKEEFTRCARRESIQSVQTMQGMGNAFKVEDEEGEVFDTNYLADMKAGRCSDAPDLERLSVLQLRNAQCKPHLKSSYPAETQFQPGTFTEEEIKSGSALEDVFNDSLSQSLLPGEKTKKRDRTQTLYKRPGPPTPSKNGGRLSLQGNESRSPNLRILRERNVERRSTATPRRLKDLFGGNSRRQDENVSGTPKGRRLSSIFRKPK